MNRVSQAPSVGDTTVMKAMCRRAAFLLASSFHTSCREMFDCLVAYQNNGGGNSSVVRWSSETALQYMHCIVLHGSVDKWTELRRVLNQGGESGESSNNGSTTNNQGNHMLYQAIRVCDDVDVLCSLLMVHQTNVEPSDDEKELEKNQEGHGGAKTSVTDPIVSLKDPIVLQVVKELCTKQRQEESKRSKNDDWWLTETLLGWQMCNNTGHDNNNEGNHNNTQERKNRLKVMLRSELRQKLAACGVGLMMSYHNQQWTSTPVHDSVASVVESLECVRKIVVASNHHHHHHHNNGQEQPIFYSRVEQESSNDARKRKKAKETAVAYTPAVPQVLQRQAARNAFFSMQGFDNAPRDWELLNMIHICRSLYIETSKNVTLAQYASLTRNFMRVVLERLSDPMVQKLWKELREYRQKLDELGVTDKYIRKFVKFDLDQDGDVTVKEQMRSELSLVLQQNRLELAKQAVLVPLGVIGNVIHAPVIILSKYLGVKMGVSDTRDGGAPSDNESMDGKDLSVVATMEMLGGLVGLAMLYPSIAVATMVLTPLSPLVTVSCVAMSGYAMALGQPVEVFVRNIKAAQKMHSSKHSTQLISDLKQRREDLQRGLRSFADLHAPDDMKGWWRDPESYVQGLKLQQIEAERQWLSRHQRVTPDLIEAANLNVFTVPLKRNLRHPLERAVLTSKTEPGNTKALFWLSGRNDAFYHIHILDRLLATGFDLYALDLRRCGRAKYDTSGTEVTPELYAHDTFDFGEYNEEIDAVLKFLKNPGRLPANQVVHEGGCGKVYDSIVCYAHSTGGLVAASYGARGSKNSGAWRGAIDGYIFNSPFLEFNLPWYQNGLVQHADLVDPERIISQGGADSLYSRKLYQNYGFHVPEHKSLKELHVTAGWLAAVTDVQKNLVQGKLRLPPNKPTLVLSTSADEVLSQEHIQQRIPFLSADPNEEKQPIDKAIWENGVVERRIGTDDKNQSAHDVLAASPSRVAEAMNHIDRWLGVNFP